MSVVFRLIKSWWPNAGSSTLLNLELPVISIIVTVYSYDSLSSYANALAIFMFANAFVFPVTTVIIKEGTGIITRRYVTNLIFVVFLITNALLVVYGLKYNSSDMLLMHVFSISIVSVGVRRYLHGVVILKEATTIIFPASIFRLIVSTCCCYLLITKGVSSAFAPIVALVLGSWVESLVLLIYVQKKRLNSASGEVSLDRKSVFQVYSSALFIMASALMSNTLITYIINTSNYVSRNDLLEYWAIFFGVVCISTSSIFYLDNFIIRYYRNIDRPSDLAKFTGVAFLSAALMSVIYIIILFNIISPNNIDELSVHFYDIIALSIFVSLFWSLRSITRAKLILSSSTKMTILSIAASFIVVLVFNRYMQWGNDYLVLSPVISYLMIIVFELVFHVAFFINTHHKEKSRELIKES